LFRSGGTGNPSSIIQSGGTSSGNQGIVFKHGDFGAEVERMRIDSSGSVGIGTSSPTALLSVSNATYLSNAATTGSKITLNSENTSSWTGTRELVALESVGNGADHRTGSFSLKVKASSAATNLQEYMYVNGVSDYTTFSTGGTEAMRIDSSGNVSIGGSAISNAALTIENSANTKVIMRMSTATAGEYWRQEVDASNDFYLVDNAGTGVYITDGSTSWSGISDENLKENIVELTGALDKIKDYRCVEYNLIADETDSKKIGFIAQDWQADYSEVVSQDRDGNLGMKYTETIPVLLKAIQEQQTLIESLTTRIAALEE
jgi:hypothetical protein